MMVFDAYAKSKVQLAGLKQRHVRRSVGRHALSDVFATKTTMKTKAVFSSLTPALHDVHAAINAMVSLMVAIRENRYGNVNFIPF